MFSRMSRADHASHWIIEAQASTRQGLGAQYLRVQAGATPLSDRNPAARSDSQVARARAAKTTASTRRKW
jgi:hypothetical protein